MSRFSILVLSFALSAGPGLGVAQAKPAKSAPAKPASVDSACSAGQRLFNVTNTSGQQIWLGITSGTISCLADSDCPTGAAGSCQGANPGAGVAGTCSCTGGCGTVSQCNSADNFCHWNLPTVGAVNLQSGQSTTLCFPAAQAGKKIQWSGNIFARTGCSATEPCQTGDCGTLGGKPCPVGKGGNPPATLAEFTLSNPAVTTAGPDFYDISIINGVNLAVSMGPVTGTFQPTAGDPYSCGTPGSATAFGKLSGCPWTIQPTVAGVDQTALLRNILPQTLTTCPNSANQPNSLGYCPCAKDSDCSSSNLLCGLAMNASSTQKFAQVCGTQIAWWTADQICGASIGTSTPYGAPLNCASTVTNSDKSTSTYTNLYICTQPGGSNNPEQAQSCYSNGAVVDCCGCATSASAPLSKDWPKVFSPSFPGKDNGCFNNNPSWDSIAQPWLVFLKQACPTAYTYPFDDATSTFTCSGSASNPPAYNVTFFATK